MKLATKMVIKESKFLNDFTYKYLQYFIGLVDEKKPICKNRCEK